jgi:uncharacterized protein YkwD
VHPNAANAATSIMTQHAHSTAVHKTRSSTIKKQRTQYSSQTRSSSNKKQLNQDAAQTRSSINQKRQKQNASQIRNSTYKIWRAIGRNYLHIRVDG